MNFTIEILEYLKKSYENATNKQMISDLDMNSKQAPYYFRFLEDNLIEPMSEVTLKRYSQADGNELEQKMKALRSSSAMTYNIIGNDHVIVKDSSQYFIPGRYQVFFEEQLPTLKRNPRKANMDVFLKSEQELIFCEMKMTEWLFNKPGVLKESYFDRNRYFDADAFQAFSSCLDKIVLEEPTDYGTYHSALEQYDVLQMYKHTLAVYNYAIKNKGNIPSVIRLVNCVWHLPETDFLSEDAKVFYETKEMCEYKEFIFFYKATEEIRKRFEKLGFDFDILFLDAKEFVQQLSKNSEQLEYLKRYFL